MFDSGIRWATNGWLEVEGISALGVLNEDKELSMQTGFCFLKVVDHLCLLRFEFFKEVGLPAIAYIADHFDRSPIKGSQCTDSTLGSVSQMNDFNPVSFLWLDLDFLKLLVSF